MNEALTEALILVGSSLGLHSANSQGLISGNSLIVENLIGSSVTVGPNPSQYHRAAPSQVPQQQHIIAGALKSVSNSNNQHITTSKNPITTSSHNMNNIMQAAGPYYGIDPRTVNNLHQQITQQQQQQHLQQLQQRQQQQQQNHIHQQLLQQQQLHQQHQNLLQHKQHQQPQVQHSTPIGVPNSPAPTPPEKADDRPIGYGAFGVVW